MKMKNTIKYMAVLALGLVACEPEFDNSIEENEVYTNGEANFSNYVALGNSLTAGFADNALYRQGQENSYPNILANQFSLVGGGDFRQPLTNDNLGGLLLNGTQIQGTRLILDVNAAGDLGPVNIPGTPTTEISNTLSGSFNNMGVPGAKSFHLVAPGYGNIAGVATGQANPYFVRFRSSDNATVLEDALAQNPTFFSLWIGNNDVLSFATSGGVGVNQAGNIDPTTYGSNDLTDPNVFAQVFTGQVESLLSSATGGVVMNIPSVTSAPFFTTVPVNAIPLDAQTAGLLNSQFQLYNTQVLPGLVQFGVISAEEAALRQVNFQEGQNFVTIQDEELTDLSQVLQGPPFNLDPQTAGVLSQVRQATSEDLIPLTSAGFLGTTVNNNPQLINGVSVPLGDQHVLTKAEQDMIAEVTANFNATIKGVADANGLAFVDANAVLSRVAGDGIVFDGGLITAEFPTGGAFSLDGIHLTPRGYAVIANEIIKSVNRTYNSTVPRVNVGNYNGGPAIGSGSGN
jgi:lysophospholipase L1-like esterase